MKLDSSEDLRHELTALNDWFLCEFDRLHSAWLQTDSDDKTWLNTLLDQWRAKHKALMGAWNTGGAYDSTEDT